jgi:hypothetical protein
MSYLRCIAQHEKCLIRRLSYHRVMLLYHRVLSSCIIIEVVSFLSQEGENDGILLFILRIVLEPNLENIGDPPFTLCTTSNQQQLWFTLLEQQHHAIPMWSSNSSNLYMFV